MIKKIVFMCLMVGAMIVPGCRWYSEANVKSWKGSIDFKGEKKQEQILKKQIEKREKAVSESHKEYKKILNEIKNGGKTNE